MSGESASSAASTRRDYVYPDLYEASVVELQAGLDAGHFSSVDLVKVIFVLRWILIDLSDLTTFCTHL